MYKTILSLFFISFTSFVYGAESSNLVDCNKIFEQRRGELLREIEKIDEEQQMLQALQSANQSMLDKKEQALNQKELEVNATLEQISQKEANIKRLIEENKKLLEAVKKSKDDKMTDTYAKMKASAAAGIIENLPVDDGALILFNLEPKIISKIFAKMDPVKASGLTIRLQKGPPFKEENSSN